MIIQCINCNKKFNVNSELIPSTGRTIQCGSCNHTWFFDPSYQPPSINDEIQNHEEIENIDEKIQSEKALVETDETTKKFFDQDKIDNIDFKEKKKDKSQSKKYFSFGKFLSYLIVAIITLAALILIIDTFKTPLYDLFPSLENLLFSLFEIFKDIKLFINDLIQL